MVKTKDEILAELPNFYGTEIGTAVRWPANRTATAGYAMLSSSAATNTSRATAATTGSSNRRKVTTNANQRQTRKLSQGAAWSQ